MAVYNSTCSVLTENSIDTTDASSTRISTKYGDSDLTSKRRKHDDEPQLTSLDDYTEFSEKSLDIDFNSTLIMSDTNNVNLLKNHSQEENRASSLNYSDYDSFSSICSRSSCSDSAKQTNIPFISEKPSDTSFGLENTFRVLEKQIRPKSVRSKYLRRISEEYIPTMTSLSVDPNAVVDELAQQQEQQHMSEEHEDNDDEYDKPTFFELELEAMQRVRQHLQQANPDLFTRLNESSTESVTSPLNELLYGFNPIGLENSPNTTTDSNEFTSDQSGDYPEYVYHIAKRKDGREYLKVLRSLLIDKVLCGNRVSQMTRAYDDIEAVTRLLEEKEKDLELTVQIGKELLTQNNRLENRVAELEAELKAHIEEKAQLVHELHQKNELVAILTNDVDDGSENATPTVSKSLNLDLLQKKIATLQDENKSLKQEASQLAKQTDEVEEQERKLMEDITSQLNSTNSQFDSLLQELERQKEENRLQHEQIISLQARLSETEMRLHKVTVENDEQISQLSITRENQNMLAAELAEFKSRYQEILALYQEAQEQLRKQKKKLQPHTRSSYLSGLGIPQQDSLLSELMETSLYSENSLDSGISADRMSAGGIGKNSNVPAFKKVFETVQCAAKFGTYADTVSQMGAMSLSSSSQPRMSAMPYVPPTGSYHRPSSVYSGSTYPSYESSMGVKTMSCESLASQSDDGYPSQPSGVPGAPGAKDLEAALKRLTPAEVLARRAMLSHAPAGTYSYEDHQHAMPYGLRTPDSIMSTGSSGASHMATNQWRLPEKLQIVKPMEGSQTLHHWSRLATPTLSGLLEERPGVTIRGGRGLEELGLQTYSLSDVEEDVDEDYDDHPGKQFQASGCIYTFTNSTVMHPDDGTMAALFSLPQSQISSRMASQSTSRQPSCPPTPRAGMSRRNSCSTFSVNMGLASMLNERGIKAVTPSALNTPAGPNYSPTVTPCNSPEGSPTRSMSPEPLFGLLSSGADLIRRKLIGEIDRPTRTPQSNKQKIMLSRLERRALRSLRLVEKVESVGLENIITTQPNAMRQLSGGIASRSASPMAQLTSLKKLQPSSSSASSSSGVDDVQFNRNQIRAVLSKGLSNDCLKNLAESDIGSSIASNFSSSSLSSMDSDKENLTGTKDAHAPKPEGSTNNNSSSTTLQKPFITLPINNDDNLIAQTTTANSTATDIRIKQMQRQKSRRNLKNGIGGQRPDLGTVGGRVRPDLGKVDVSSKTLSRNNNNANDKQQTEEKMTTQSITQSFVGSISSLFFGRKGGLL